MKSSWIQELHIINFTEWIIEIPKLPIIVFTKMNIVKGLIICLGITSNIDYFGTRHVFITYKHIIIYTRVLDTHVISNNGVYIIIICKPQYCDNTIFSIVVLE